MPEPDWDTWNRWKNDPDNWIWGVFYFNRQDPRLFVPKKIEWMGFTINFAHKMGTVVFSALIFYILIMAALPFISRIFTLHETFVRISFNAGTVVRGLTTNAVGETVKDSKMLAANKVTAAISATAEMGRNRHAAIAIRS